MNFDQPNPEKIPEGEKYKRKLILWAIGATLKIKIDQNADPKRILNEMPSEDLERFRVRYNLLSTDNPNQLYEEAVEKTRQTMVTSFMLPKSATFEEIQAEEIRRESLEDEEEREEGSSDDEREDESEL